MAGYQLRPGEDLVLHLELPLELVLQLLLQLNLLLLVNPHLLDLVEKLLRVDDLLRQHGLVFREAAALEVRRLLLGLRHARGGRLRNCELIWGDFLGSDDLLVLELSLFLGFLEVASHRGVFSRWNSDHLASHCRCLEEGLLRGELEQRHLFGDSMGRVATIRPNESRVLARLHVVLLARLLLDILHKQRRAKVLLALSLRVLTSKSMRIGLLERFVLG